MERNILEKKFDQKPFVPSSVSANQDLKDLNKAWDPARIYSVCEGVYAAVGYGRSNPVLIEGDDGCIIVDPGESITSATQVKTAYEELLGDDFFSKKPVKAIIYTHYHDCHIHGASVFAGNNKPEIICQERLPHNLFSLSGALYSMVFPIKAYRAIKYMGLRYQDNKDYFVNGGIFSCSIPGSSGYIPPTIKVKDELTTTIAGVTLNLIYAPGETTDIIFVWLPDKEVLVQIGDFYKSFPAITTLRGASFRNPLDYIKSIDKMLSLDAEYLILIHGGAPLSGKDNIRKNLTNARDANQYIHDQTLQCMNMGMTPGEIIEAVTLPTHLANQPYLQEYFGDVERVIFQIFSQYMGWFSGKSRDLYPMSPMEKAQAAEKLAGGLEQLKEKAQESLDNAKEYNSEKKITYLKWALIFADYVLLLESNDSASDFKSAREIKYSAMLQLAEETKNAQTRNYLLSEYLEETDQISIDIPQFKNIDDHLIQYMPMDTLFGIMGVNLIAVKSLNVLQLVVGLHEYQDAQGTTDTDYTMEVRRGILAVKEQTPDNPKFTINVRSFDDWKKVVLGKVTPQKAVNDKLVSILGGTNDDFYEFMSLFLFSQESESK